MHTSTFAIFAAAALTSAATAQQTPPASPAPTPNPATTPSPTDPLAGPTVIDSKDIHPSLVQSDFDGRIKLVDGSPEEAALKLLKLDEEQRKAAEAVFADRAHLLDEFVAENLLLLGQMDTADKAGDKKTQGALLVKALQELRPVLDKGKLEDRIAETIPADREPEYRALLKEYWAAIVKDRRSVPKPDGKRPGRIEVMAQAKLETFGKEVERSYQRIEQSGELAFRYIFKGVTLAPEQKGKIRELFALHAQQTKGNASEKENGELFLAVLPHLTPDQAKLVMKNIKGQ